MSKAASLIGRVALIVPLLAAPLHAARADDIAKFYAGKTLNIVVGVEAGGFYSTFAVILARHMGGHIPGRPTVIVQHMPGAGGSIAMNWAYNVAPKDGTVMLTPEGAPHLRVPLGLDKPTYDTSKFRWVGGWSEGVSTVTLRKDIAPVKSLAEARTTEVILGAIGKSSNTYLIPALINNTLGTRFRIITGYRGGAPIRLAMEKGEVQGWAGQWDSWKQLSPGWVRDGNLVHLAQIASKPTPDLADVPLLSSFARTDEERIIFRVIENGLANRALALPPGVPEPRVAAISNAYQATLRDPRFLQDAAAAKFGIDPIPGEAIQKFVESISALPPATVARIKKAMELE